MKPRGGGIARLGHCFPCLKIYTVYFCKNTLYKNTEAQFAKKIRARLELAQPPMSNKQHLQQFDFSDKLTSCQLHHSFGKHILMRLLLINKSIRCVIFNSSPRPNGLGTLYCT